MTLATDRETRHFDFGRNWSDYSARVDDAAIIAAKRGLDRLGLNDLKGKTFIDVGCGSGIHSLAAAERGAVVTAVDIDADSVATTKRVLRHRGIEAVVRQCSVFESADMGEFDVVYSWGVLHHTGDVWGAIDSAADRVKLGGSLAIALYEESRLCWAWQPIKRLYSKLGRALRSPIKYVFGGALLFSSCARQRALPSSYLSMYHRNRGMSFWHDVDDWLGGYPYQSTRSNEVISFLGQRGFVPNHVSALSRPIGVFGTGCSEFNFIKRHLSKSDNRSK